MDILVAVAIYFTGFLHRLRIMHSQRVGQVTLPSLFFPVLQFKPPPDPTISVVCYLIAV